MKIQKERIIVMDRINGQKILEKLEKIGRISHKSEDKITKGSAEKFIRKLIQLGHESVLEHHQITVKIICDRGISHEIVRHRIGSYTQESTRYCAYKELEIILPLEIKKNKEAKKIFLNQIKEIEKTYLILLEKGVSPEIARNILPHALKTEIYCTFNLRQWRHIFSLRCSLNAHPQIRRIFLKILKTFQKRIPVIFEDFLIDEEKGFAIKKSI
ncbi:MAG: FAD-dependent thymidylate synthase [Minisyncoccia bacterium]